MFFDFVIFLDSAKMVSTDLIFYAASNDPVTLNITVRAFNGDVDANFTWFTDNKSVVIDGVESSKLADEEFCSILSIPSVEKEHYGNYTVTVTNGMENSSIFVLTLVEQGK